MSTPLSRHEIRAAAAAHHELGPEYADDVVASFLGQHNFWSRDVVALILLAIVALNVAVVVRLRRPRGDG